VDRHELVDAVLLEPGEELPGGTSPNRDLSCGPTDARLGAAARARALAEFGMNRMLERVEALYRQLLASSDGSRLGAAPAMSRP